jgi:hypothetical protein
MAFCKPEYPVSRKPPVKLPFAREILVLIEGLGYEIENSHLNLSHGFEGLAAEKFSVCEEICVSLITYQKMSRQCCDHLLELITSSSSDSESVSMGAYLSGNEPLNSAPHLTLCALHIRFGSVMRKIRAHDISRGNRSGLIRIGGRIGVMRSVARCST